MQDSTRQGLLPSSINTKVRWGADVYNCDRFSGVEASTFSGLASLVLTLGICLGLGVGIDIGLSLGSLGLQNPLE